MENAASPSGVSRLSVLTPAGENTGYPRTGREESLAGEYPGYDRCGLQPGWVVDGPVNDK